MEFKLEIGSVNVKVTVEKGLSKNRNHLIFVDYQTQLQIYLNEVDKSTCLGIIAKSDIKRLAKSC